jgi:hypothetical protein
MKTEFLQIVPVLPSADIDRDVNWYNTKIGFETVFANEMYAVLQREGIYLHLQWHADTDDDPLLGGSVIRIVVKNLQSILAELVEQEIVSADKLILNTPWQTNEFGFYDLNQNAIFIVEAIE